MSMGNIYYIYKPRRNKRKSKWSWKSFYYGLFTGGLVFLVLGYLWGVGAGK